MTITDEQQTRDESAVDWKTFKVILCVAPALFLIVAIFADSWSTVIGLAVFAPVIAALFVLREGHRRSVTLHVAVAMLVVYQVLLLRATVAEPNIGLIWFLAVPVIVGLLGNRLHVLIWTPIALGCVAYCWSLYAQHPTLAHPLALPNLLAATLVIACAAFGMIVQRDRRERALREAVQEARKEARDRERAELETSKSRAAITRFLGSVSHELRTPLTSITLSVDVLERSLTDPAGKVWLNNIRSSAKSLITLLNDVLDLAHSDAGRTALQTTAFELEDMLDGVRAIVEPLVSEQDVEWFMAMMPNVPASYVGDETRLRQVLVNLVSNALRHAKPSRVWLIVELQNGRLYFEVGDDGAGIAVDAQREIFQPFKQLAPSADASERKGTGLGLTISAGYVKAMGGRLDVQSAPGNGAVFCFSLPLTDDQAQRLGERYPSSVDWPQSVELVSGAARHIAWARAWLEHWRIQIEQEAVALSLTGEPLPSGSVSELQARLDAAAVSAPDTGSEIATDSRSEGTSGTSLRCVVCDDEPIILHMLQMLLREAGHDVACFEAPEPLLLYLAAATSDVILLDVNLGATSGLDVLRQIRARPATAEVPVCMLSGSVEFRDDALAAGADDYLVKPSSPDEILAMVMRLGVGRPAYRDTCVST